MASSRPLRGRRLASPLHQQAPPSISIKTENAVNHGQDFLLDAWEEPEPRTPVPSFQDHKGLERQGVLEHMAPLGHLPGQKLKAKIKAQEQASRRMPQARNGDNRMAREAANLEHSVPPPASRRQEPRRTDAHTKSRGSRERHGDQDEFEPKLTRPMPAKHVPIQPATNGASTTRAAIPKNKLRDVVEKAAKRSAEIGNPGLGLAITKLYEDSLQDQQVAELLDAVLTQKQTPEQVTVFQSYVKSAKKRIKYDSKTQTAYKSQPNSPVMGKPTVRRQSGITNDASHAVGLTTLPSPHSHKSPAKFHHHNIMVNGSPMKEERPAKRMKRTNSASSDSPLSSLGSGVDDFTSEQVDSTPFEESPESHQTPYAHFKGPAKSAAPNHHTIPDLGGFQSTTNDVSYEELTAKRRKMQQERHFDDYRVADSSVRPLLRDPKPVQITPPRTLSPSRQQPPSRLRGSTTQRNRRYNDDDDDDALSSPPSSPGDLLVPPPFGALRGETPSQHGRLPRPGQKGPRIKMSPQKKRNGVTAGIAQKSDAENGSSGNRRLEDNRDHENSEACSACSGNGKLVCCDNCDRAFHLTCIDPPVGSEESLDEQWFCQKCTKAHHGIVSSSRAFKRLDDENDARNPAAFVLPFGIRDYFEGVRSGEEAEYEEVNVSKTIKNRAGYEQNPNNFKLTNNKDNVVLCHQCGLSSLDGRELVGCDYCLLSWHLDCVVPPLATAPNKKKDGGDKPRATWKCPCHVDQELVDDEPGPKRLKRSADAAEAPTQRRFKSRKAKYGKIIDSTVTRGLKNYGILDIDNEPSDEDSEVEREISGNVYRVPELSIKLDFIDRINVERLKAKQAKPQPQTHSRGNQTDVTAVNDKHLPDDNLPFAQRKAALNLTQLANNDAALDSDSVQNLISTLIAEAPENVASLATLDEEKNKQKEATSKKGQTSQQTQTTTNAAEISARTVDPLSEPVSEEERNDLLHLIELARRRLERGRK